MSYLPYIAGGAALGLAARGRRAAPTPRVNVGRILKETYRKSARRPSEQILGKWTNHIERSFSSAFPNWKLDVAMEPREEWHGPGDREEWLSITMELLPSSKHPDIEWMSTLEPEKGRAMDEWFKHEFGLYPSFWNGAMDMQRDPGFPAVNGQPMAVHYR